MKFDCYKLIKEKEMHDGNIIPKDVKLYCIKNEDNVLFLMHDVDNENKTFFWANFDELYFDSEEDKDFDLDLTDILNGDYFNLI